MFEHQDALEQLNQHAPLKEKLIYAHELVAARFSFIARIAVTFYDPDTRVLKSYLNTSLHSKEAM